MINNIFDEIEIFNSPDLLFEKFKNSNEYISLKNCKKAFYFVFGKKLKISEFGLEENLDLYNFKQIYYKLKHNESSSINYDLIFCFYQSILGQDLTKESFITFSNFSSKLKQFYPFLSNDFIKEIFCSLDNDKDGFLKLSDFQESILESV
jgi:hypothetical protein